MRQKEGKVTTIMNGKQTLLGSYRPWEENKRHYEKSYAEEFVNLDEKNKPVEEHNLKSWREEKQTI